MIIRHAFTVIKRKGAALALAALLLLQALPVTFQTPFPLLEEARGEESSYTVVNICGGDGSAGACQAGDFLCTPPPLSPPPQAWSVPALPLDDGAPPPGPHRRLYRPPRPALRS